MKAFLTGLAILGVAYAGVIPAIPPVALEHPGQITTQYHSQDELGQYSYGYAGGPSAKEEIKTADGITRGGYAYIDGNGLVQSAKYISDPVNGFRVAATNLPVGPAVPDKTVAVAAAPVVAAAAPVVVAPAVAAVEPAPVKPVLVSAPVEPIVVAPVTPVVSEKVAVVSADPAEHIINAEVEAADEAQAVADAINEAHDAARTQAGDDAQALLDAAADITSNANVQAADDAQAAADNASENKDQAIEVAIDSQNAALDQVSTQQAKLDGVLADDKIAVVAPVNPDVPVPIATRGAIPGPIAVSAPVVVPAPVAVASRVAVPAPVAVAAPVALPAPIAVASRVAIPAPVAPVVETRVVPAPVGVPVAGPVALEHPGQVLTQYHSQDELGQYSYGYAGGPSAKDELKTADGVTRGGYSYIDAHGLVQSAAYVSDHVNGFRVAATNIPLPRQPEYIPDSVEVAEAKAKLFAAQAEHIAKL